MKKNVILFGASNLGNIAYELLKEEYNICYYCDNNVEKIGTELHEIEIINIDRLKEIYKDYDIIITSQYFKEISAQLEGVDIKEYKIFQILNFNNSYMLKQRKDLEKNLYEIAYYNDKVKFYLPNLNDYVQKTIHDNCMFFEIEILEKLKSLNLNDKTIIDVGANIGNHSLFFAKNINSSKVYSFEPNKKIINILRKNMKINGVEEKVNVTNIGLGNKNSKGSMGKIDANNIGGSKIVVSESGEFEVRTLDEVFENSDEQIGLIKIDVEGMEIEVLEGGGKLIDKFRPIICVEAHGDKHYNKIFDFLRKYKYKEVYYDNLETYIFSV